MERTQAKSFVEANVSCTCGLMITGGLSVGSTSAEKLLEFVASEHTGAHHRVSVTISKTIHESELLTPGIVRERIDQYNRRTESRPLAPPVDGASSATENGMTGQSKRKTPKDVWDPADEKPLRAMHADGKSVLEIAVVTGRPRYLIESVLQEFGLVGNPDPLNLRTAMRQRITKQLPTAHQSWWNNKELEWWQLEELELIELRLKGITSAEISRLLSRPETSVLRRLKELRLAGTAPQGEGTSPTLDQNNVTDSRPPAKSSQSGQFHCYTCGKSYSGVGIDSACPDCETMNRTLASQPAKSANSMGGNIKSNVSKPSRFDKWDQRF